MTTTRTVRIPLLPQHEGIYGVELTLPWTCLQCGGPRGEPYDSLSYDGSLRMNVHSWSNPCGHVETYEEVRQAYAKQVMHSVGDDKGRVANVQLAPPLPVTQPVPPKDQFDHAYPDLRQEQADSDKLLVQLVDGDFAMVDIVNDPLVTEQLERDHGTGNLMSDVPSISLQVNRQVFYLTWAEAYSLGRALCKVADVAHYG